MVTAITTTTTTIPATTGATTTHPATTTSSSTGASSGASTISSAAPESKSCSEQISAWVASVVNSVRGCLANLWWIGHWFETTPEPVTNPVTTNPLPTTTTTTWTDVEIVAMIRGQFQAPPVSTTAGTTVAAPGVPLPDVVAYTLNLFRGITSPVCKMEAFQAVLVATNSTEEIAKQFYEALPDGTSGVEASKAAFRAHIYAANHNNDEGHGIGFGEFIIYSPRVRSDLTSLAATNLTNALRTAASSSVASTSGATA
jgi:hypothetical protein